MSNSLPGFREPDLSRISGQRAVRFESGGPSPGDVMGWLREIPLAELGDLGVTNFDDLLDPDDQRERTDALVFHLAGGAVTVRPGQTEAELMLYGEFWRPASENLDIDRTKAHAQLAGAINAMTSLVSDPERARTTKRMSAGVADADLETLASTLFAQSPQGLPMAQALRLIVRSIDLTTLAGDDTDGRVRALCAQACRPDPADPSVGPTAAVCVYPNLVGLAAELTQGSGVAVASVAGAFPSGLSSLEVRLTDIAEAVCAGAAEIDVVMNRAAFLAGHHDVVLGELQAMREQVGARVMKVILEVSELGSPAAIRSAAGLAMRAGADWIKTSTGKSGGGATPIAVLAMAQAILEFEQQQGKQVGLKISGGVRTSADALGYLAIIEDTLGSSWLQPDRVRFGASGLLTAVVEDLAAERT